MTPAADIDADVSPVIYVLFYEPCAFARACRISFAQVSADLLPRLCWFCSSSGCTGCTPARPILFCSSFSPYNSFPPAARLLRPACADKQPHPSGPASEDCSILPRQYPGSFYCFSTPEPWSQHRPRPFARPHEWQIAGLPPSQSAR